MTTNIQSVLLTGLLLKTNDPVIFRDQLCFIGDVNLTDNKNVLKVFKSQEDFQKALNDGGIEEFAIAAYRFSYDHEYIVVQNQSIH